MAANKITLTQLYERYKDDYTLSDNDLFLITDTDRSSGQKEASRAIKLSQLIEYIFGKTIHLGDGKDTEVNIVGNLGRGDYSEGDDSSKNYNPIIRYNNINNKWQFSNDGINFSNFDSNGNSKLNVNGTYEVDNINFSNEFEISLVDDKLNIKLNIKELIEELVNDDSFIDKVSEKVASNDTLIQSTTKIIESKLEWKKY